MANKWFLDQFLPGLRVKAVCGKTTISERQCDVCKKYMQAESGVSIRSGIHYVCHDSDGRKVTLFVKAGKYGMYGEIYYGLTPAETEEFAKKNIEKEAELKNRVWRRHTDRFAAEIEEAKINLSYAIEDGEEKSAYFLEKCLEGII